MMHAFTHVPGGYEAYADSAERQILARLAADVCELLGYPLEELWNERRREEEAYADADQLAAYEADLSSEPSGAVAQLAAQLAERAARDEAGIPARPGGVPVESSEAAPAKRSDGAYRALMPDVWANEEDSQAFASAYSASISHAKAEALALFYVSLVGTNTVTLDNAEAVQWVQAATSIRLVLAERLGLRADEDAEALAHATELYMAGERPPEFAEEWRASMALAYAMISWWQDSLVQAMRRKMLRG